MSLKIIHQEDQISELFTNGIYFIRTKNEERYETIIQNCIDRNFKPKKIFIVSDELVEVSLMNYLQEKFSKILLSPIENILEKEYKDTIKITYYKKPKIIIGITGSSGKSSITYGIYQILRKFFDKKVFLSSSAGIGSDKLLKNSLSCPPFADFHYYLHNYGDCDYGILEITSQGLDQKRIEGISLDIGVITSIQNDHLDYHKNMNNYIIAKLQIINYIKPGGILLIDSKILNILNNEQRQLFHTYSKNIRVLEIIVNSYGDYNPYQSFNVSTCFMILQLLNLDISKVTTMNYIFPPGRFFEISTSKDSRVIVDGAHNLDQIKNIIELYRNKNQIIIYGISGHRINGDMNNIEIILSNLRPEDQFFIVDDNPGVIDADFICNRIYEKCKNFINVINIGNRFAAIERAVKEGNTNILILGKSTETKNIIEFRYQEKDLENFFISKLSYLKYISQVIIADSLTTSAKIWKKIESMKFEKKDSNIWINSNPKYNSMDLIIEKVQSEIIFQIVYDEINFLTHLLKS